ncbi:hypothetical protein ACA910_015027 [Epithemia clementina (nom. ined.)]
MSNHGLIFLISAVILVLQLQKDGVQAYHRQPCSRHVASDFSFPDCYLPSQPDELLLSSASFVYSHDAATGYIQIGFSKTGLSSLYSKTQLGTLYEQLNNGARALDLRPLLLANGTTIFHHGAIRIQKTFQDALQDVVQWAADNPTELVLLITSHFDYENSNQYDDDPYALTNTLQSIYSEFGISYMNCEAINGYTIGDAKQAAALSGGEKGYLLAVDGHDFYGSSCTKSNYIESEMVTCWGNNNSTSCKNSKGQWEKLKKYILASANNEATDDKSQLGPPKSLDVYPFNEVQALWQVDSHAIAMGLAHLSSILEDNAASDVNADVVDLIYDGAFNSISLLTVDNVAVHGNALLSALRNTCGQSTLEECGKDVPRPPMRRWRLRRSDVFSVLLACYAFLVVALFFYRRPKLLSTFCARARNQDNDGLQDPIHHQTRRQSLLSAKDRQASF